MDELTPEELALLTPEEQEEYAQLMEQERQMAAPPTPEVMEAAPVPQEEGMLSQAYDTLAPYAEPFLEAGEAFAKGVGQGFTSGGSEEVLAGLEAATGGTYEEAKKRQEASFKKSEEESPFLTAGGELVGSIAQGAALTAATGGAGLPVAIGNALTKLSKINKAAQLAFKVGKPLARIAKTAAIGATEGALSAALRSEKSLQEQAKEGFKESKMAAESGAVLGGGIETLGKIAKKTASVTGDVISKRIDEGKFFPSARPIREAWRYGTKGVGFSSEESLRRPVKNLMNAIEKKIQPKIQIAMRETKDLSDYILRNVPKKVEVDDIVQSGISQLKSEGNFDAKELASVISSKYKAIKEVAEPVRDIYGQATGEAPKISLMEAKTLVRDIQKHLDSKANLKLNAGIQNIAKKIQKDIDSLIDSSITDADAVEAVLKDPEQTINFFNILRKSSPKSLAEKELEKFSGRLTDKAALKKAKDVSNKITQSYQGNIEAIMNNLDKLPMESKVSRMSQILQDPRSRGILQEAGKNLGPVKILDGKMKNILSAQELLTGELFPKTDVEKAEQVMSLFKLISGQTKEGVTADVNRATYDKALDLLGTAFPEVADDLDKIVKPITQDLFMIRYLHGIGFDPALKDTAVVQRVLGPGTKLTAQAANIASQSLEAANRGAAGPIVGLFSTTAIRPTKSVLESIKRRIDSKSGVYGMMNDSISKMISDRLQDALNAPDEGRRIAILNALMQYSQFRNIMNEENQSE